MAWSAPSTLRGPRGLVGPRGASYLFGDDTPGASLGSDGDIFFDRSARTFYRKANGAWASIGNAYNTTAVGTAQPGTNFGNPGDTYLQVVGGLTYLWAKSGITWNRVALLTGQPGPPGADSTVPGPKGDPGKDGAASTVPGPKGDPGPASPGLYSGSGPPSATNPSGPQVDGSYYLRNDVIPALQYGPLANGVWPTDGQSTGGSQTLYGQGPPAANLGARNDVYYDLQNSFFWPPKQATGWVLAPVNQVGPTGPKGPTTSYRQSVRGFYWNGTTAITANTAYPIYTPIVTDVNTTYRLPLVETMFASGSLTAIAANSPTGIPAATVSLNILKNGTVVHQAASFLITGTAAGSASKVLPTTGLTFLPNDLITMTMSSSVGTANQSFCVTLFYTTNS